MFSSLSTYLIRHLFAEGREKARGHGERGQPSTDSNQVQGKPIYDNRLAIFFS